MQEGPALDLNGLVVVEIKIPCAWRRRERLCGCASARFWAYLWPCGHIPSTTLLTKRFASEVLAKTS
jgi:hypothetical protein